MTEYITEDTRSRPSKLYAVVRNPHLWIIVALMTILTTAYYAGNLNLNLIPLIERFLTSDYIHDLHRALFIIPMLYAAIAFRIRGAAAVSLIVFCVVLPRALFLSPNEDPLLRTVIFIVLASLVTVLLSLERDRGQGEKEALKELGVAHKELENKVELLRASEARYRGLFNSTSDAIFVRDLKGNIIEVNQAALILTGYTLDEITGMNISDFLTPGSLQTDMEKQQALLKGESTIQHYESELTDKDGTRKIIESMARLLTEKGRAAGIQYVTRDVTEQKRISAGQQFYISAITKAQEEERRRIACELHDDTAQSLATLSLDIEEISRMEHHLTDSTIRHLEQIQKKIGDINESIRRFSHQLRPGILEQVGLVLALESLIDEMNEENKVSMRLETIGFQRRLPAETEVMLFRIIQEALRNSQAHSGATKAVVRIEYIPNKVKVKVSDNGKGFKLPEVLDEFAGQGKLGLIGMRERVRLLGGDLSLVSKAGKGTDVLVETPG